MPKLISVKKNKNYKIVSFNIIKRFLNISNSRDDDFLEEIYFSAKEYAENLLELCLGEGQYLIQYSAAELKFQNCSTKSKIKLIYSPVFEIESCEIIDCENNVYEVKNFEFSIEKQEIFLKNFNLNLSNSQDFVFQVVQKSKMDESFSKFDSIKLKLLRHINILYKNRNSYVFEKSDIDASISNIYQDLLFFLN